MKAWRTWLALLPLFFPLYLVRFEIGPIPTTFLEILVLGTAGVGLGLYWRNRQWPQNVLTNHQPWWQQILWPTLCILLAATIALVFTPAHTQGLNGLVDSGRIALGVWKGWLLVPIIYFALLLSSGRDEHWRTNSLAALTLSGVVLAGWALIQIATNHFITLDQRASGPFSSANYLSLYLVPIIVGAALMTLKSLTAKQYPQAALWASAWLVLVIALIGSHSYAGLISASIGFAISLWLNPSSSSQLKRGLTTILGLGLILAFLGQASNAKLTHLLDFQSNTSSHIRLEIYYVATQMIIQHPVLGIGLGQFETQWPLQAPIILNHSPIDWVVLHPHNLFLAFWLNTGLLGLIGLIWLIINVIRRGLNSLANQPLARVALGMLLAILIYGFVDTPYWKNDLAFSWWLIIALIV